MSLLKLWLSFEWLSRAANAHVLLVETQRNVLAGKFNIYNSLSPVYLHTRAVNTVAIWHLLPACVQK